MLAKEFFSIHQSMTAQGIVLSFTGYLSEGVLFALGETLKQKLALDATDPNTNKRVFSVFVEQVQNVIRYSTDRAEGDVPARVELSSGTVTVGRTDEKFFVTCGNMVRADDVGRLRERLELLNQMDKEALKQYYREKLKEPPEEQSKGASIGLIEIARRASEPIEFDFFPVSADTAFFCMKVYV
jgi:hypothetical protein